ncbi:MAG: PBP1A family penicillin-binding protein [Myxococcales bacterium FL481]|nr:MAG: PBP1A family penicillin-binding protein [Myxococcales bacterium FL481]
MTRRSPIPVTASRQLLVRNPAKASLLGWLLRYYAFAAAVALVGLLFVGRSAYRYFAKDLPSIAEIDRFRATAPGITRIVAADGTLLAEFARERRIYVSIDEVPAPLQQAFLAAEDRRFFEHAGLDWRGLARAMVTNLREGTVRQGGSTITQQVAKGFLSHERTLARKVREAILSLRMESQLGKAKIFEIYINKIFLGQGAYGVAAAAERYFDKPLAELTLAESALIAGLARAPSRYSPSRSVDVARARRAVVLQDMVEAGYIDDASRAAADAEPIRLAEHRDPFRWRAPYYAEEARRHLSQVLGPDVVLDGGLTIETAVDLQSQAAARESVDRAARRLDKRQGWRGPVRHLRREADRVEFLARTAREYGERVRDEDRLFLGLVTAVERRRAEVRVGTLLTTLRLRKMRWAAPYDRNSEINDVQIERSDRALEVGDVIWVRPFRRESRPDVLEVALEQTPRVEAALYMVDHETGYVEAMVGGHDYDRSQYNRTTQACRQPGSVFKAIYYALALDTPRWSMDSILEGKPWEPTDGETWSPQNIDKTIDGKVLLRTAFIKSLNTASLRLFLKLGAPEVLAWSQRLGIKSELIPDKALALGASCTRTDELLRAFGVFVRGGKTSPTHYVRRATDSEGEVVLDQRHPADPELDVGSRLDRLAARALQPAEQVIDETTAFLITRMLREVVTHGIGSGAQRIGVPAAGKSGTASKGTYTTDTWFMGFTSRYLTSAWMGDDKYERSLGERDASYTTATPLWADFMAKIVKAGDRPHGQLPLYRPPGITVKVVDATRGGPPIPGLPQATVYYRRGAAGSR